jgi:ATP-binding cassette subfamily B protein
VGSYSVLVYLTQRLLWPMTRLAELSDLYQRSTASIKRVMDLVQTPIAIPYGGARLPATAVVGEIAFDHVDFAYDGGAEPTLKPTLNDITLTIPPGHAVAFVGGTGGGKSTLVKLLLRFHEPRRGTIRLDGRPLGELDLEDLRRAIGYVAQDSFLADATVAENIAYGIPDVPRAAIVAAAVTAEAHDFVSAMPRGYDTQVGERGQKLSGGQRQRIALARAILKNPPILVLDEATSAVDNETEAAILRSLDRVVVGRTATPTSSTCLRTDVSSSRGPTTICARPAGRTRRSGDFRPASGRLPPRAARPRRRLAFPPRRSRRDARAPEWRR